MSTIIKLDPVRAKINLQFKLAVTRLERKQCTNQSQYELLREIQGNILDKHLE